MAKMRLAVTGWGLWIARDVRTNRTWLLFSSEETFIIARTSLYPQEMNYWSGTEKVTLRNWRSYWMISWFVIETRQTVGNLPTHLFTWHQYDLNGLQLGYLKKVLVRPKSFSKFVTFDIMFGRHICSSWSCKFSFYKKQLILRQRKFHV